MAGEAQIEGFGVIVRRLRAERDLSIENLALQAQIKEQEGPSVSYLGRLERGERPPTVAAMEAIAAVLDVSPAEFPEYRLAMARRLLDERAVGLGAALENYEAMVASMEQDLLDLAGPPDVPGAEQADPTGRHSPAPAQKKRKSA